MIYKDLYKLSDEIYGNACGFTSNTILKHQLYGQSKIKVLNKKKIAIEKLQKLIEMQKPRVYQFNIPGFDDRIVGGGVFSGHSFIVVQYAPDDYGEVYFKVIQSYIGTWHVQDDLKLNEFNYLKHSELVTRIVNPFFRIGRKDIRGVDKNNDFLRICGRTQSELGVHWTPLPDRIAGINIRYTSGASSSDLMPWTKQSAEPTPYSLKSRVSKFARGISRCISFEQELAVYVVIICIPMFLTLGSAIARDYKVYSSQS